MIIRYGTAIAGGLRDERLKLLVAYEAVKAVQAGTRPGGADWEILGKIMAKLLAQCWDYAWRLREELGAPGADFPESPFPQNDPDVHLAARIAGGLFARLTSLPRKSPAPQSSASAAPVSAAPVGESGLTLELSRLRSTLEAIERLVRSCPQATTADEPKGAKE